MTVWRNLRALRDSAKVGSWMHQITVREALSRAAAAHQHHELTEAIALVACPEEAVDRFDLHDGMRTALAGRSTQVVERLRLRLRLRRDGTADLAGGLLRLLQQLAHGHSTTTETRDRLRR